MAPSEACEEWRAAVRALRSRLALTFEEIDEWLDADESLYAFRPEPEAWSVGVLESS